MIRNRLAGVLSAVLFAQLSLVGASPQCRAGHAPAVGAQVAAPAGHAAGATGHGAHAPATPVTRAPGDAPPPHGLPGCAATSMCAVVMVAAPGEAVLVAVTEPASAIPTEWNRWNSVTRVPDLPPPRA